MNAPTLDELRARLEVYHEAAAYYVPHYADEVADAWADVVDLVGELTEAARVAAPAGQLALFESEGGWL